MSDPRSPEVVGELLRPLVEQVADLPFPGGGATPERHRRLAELARCEPVGLARLVEAHVDAVAICAEAGQRAVPGARYGVWASATPGGDVHIDRHAGTLRGTKAFCSGVGVLDRALVTATDADGHQWLADVDLLDPGVTLHPGGWATAALAETWTGSVELDVRRTELVGGPDWYLTRPGFWHGACGPAACWAGAAIGLADVAEPSIDDDPHRRAHLGAMRSATWGLQSLLDAAGRQIDDRPDDVVAAERRARSLRHLVERTATDVLDRFGAALGPRPFTTDAAVAQRAADLHLYLRQDHAERDLAALGRPALGRTGGRAD